MTNQEYREWEELTDKEQDMAIEQYIEDNDLSPYQTEEIFDLLYNNYDYAYNVTYWNSEVVGIEII